MKVLAFVPESQLDIKAEIFNLASDEDGLEVKIEHGILSIRAAIDVIKSYRPDSIYFAGDSATMQLEFSDGLLDAALLADAVRYLGGTHLCFFNSCESMQMALACYMAGSSYCIGWHMKVADKAAGAFSSTFWTSWKMSHDINSAYETATAMLHRSFPSEETPLLFNGRGESFRNRMAELTGQNELLIEQVKVLKQQTDRLTRLVWWLSGLLLSAMAFVLLDVFWLHI